MGKNKTIRGTKPTLIQRRILESNRKNPEEFMFVKEIVKHDSEEYNSKNRKSLNKTSDKIVCLQFINKNSGEILEIER